MKFFLDFFPIAIFVAVYAFSAEEQPMYPAVVALMVATVIQNAGTRLLTGKFEKMHLWTLGITLVAGSMTLIFRDPAFIFWKASVLVWVTAIVFLYRQHVLGKILLEEILNKTLDEAIDAPRELWSKLNHVWVSAYVLFGFLNLYVAYNFSEVFWVKFKLFGLMGLNLLLLVYIMTKIFKYLPLEEEPIIEENVSSNNPSSNSSKPSSNIQADAQTDQKSKIEKS